jgi:hypothetical protein
MTEIRPFGSWLRALSGLLAAAAVMTLTACGGGSGAPSQVLNPPAPATLAVLPATSIDLYAGVPTVLTISGGVPPYIAASSNSAIAPVNTAVSGYTIVIVPNNVAADTPINVTIRDSAGSSVIAQMTAHPSNIAASMTVTPTSTETCGENAICSGQNGTASVKLQAPAGGPVVGRAVRFDVVAGSFGIVSTAPGTPLVTSFTVTSDTLGNASVLIKSAATAPTQRAQLRATDLTTGQQVLGDFLIQQVIDGKTVLAVVPDTAKITAAYKGECSAGFVVDYYIYGGTPPYRVTSTFPTAVGLENPVVSASGGFFRTITNGTCFDPLTYSIVDATGLQTTATESNVEGTTDRPVVTPATLVITPTTQKGTSTAGKCGGFKFIVTGGTAPYNIYVSPSGTCSKSSGTGGCESTSGSQLPVTINDVSVGTSTVFVRDQGTPAQTTTATITCDGTTP